MRELSVCFRSIIILYINSVHSYIYCRYSRYLPLYYFDLQSVFHLAIETRKNNARFPSHLLNKTTRMPFEILLVMLIGAIVFPFALGIHCLHENEKTAKYSGSCIQLT